MVRGLYTAATGMMVQSKKMDIISNDLANVNTTGYKKDETIISSFPDILTSKIGGQDVTGQNVKPIGNMSLGARVDEVYTSFTQGSLIKTDGVVDIAVQGDGFLSIGTPAGVAYTRDGQFSINGEGFIVTKEGYSVLGQEGPISVGEEYLNAGGSIKIDEKGNLIVNGEAMDTLALVDFADKRTLTKMGDNLYTSITAPTEFGGSIIQGFIEASNVNPVTAMVDMITVSRAYEANQKMIQTQDTLLGKAVNEIARA